MNIDIPFAFEGLFQPKRNKVFYGGRGGAKSHAFGRALCVIGMQKTTRIICAREFQKSIKDSVHKLLSDIIRAHPIMAGFYTVLESSIRGKNGTEFIFIGLKHNVTGIKSLEGADIVWVEEAENVSDKSWEILIPTMRKTGSEIWVSFNTKNIADPTYQRFVVNAGDDTLCVKVSWRDNPFFPEVLKKEMEKLKQLDPEAHAHIWEGEPDTRRSGAVYAKQIARARDEGRICRVPYDPAAEVFTAWDLGFGDATAIWWLQFVGRELRWLDYYENDGELLGHYITEVKKRQYRYSKHFLPHDGGHGNIRGPSATEQLTLAGLRNQVLEREDALAAGIDLLRQTIEYSVFDSDKCKDGLKCLENNAYEWNEDRAQFSRNPYHDWTEHGSAAARYAAIGAGFIKSGLAARPKKINLNDIGGTWASA